MKQVRATAPWMKDAAYHRPWEIDVAPFRVAPHVYYVGNVWVGSYLVVGEREMILIDAGIREDLYLLLDSIHRLGFDPRRITRIFLSHAHFDHDDAVEPLRKLTGARVYLSREDQLFREDPSIDDAHKYKTAQYTPDENYTGEPIDLGGVVLRTLLTPGHTPGTTTFFADDVTEQGTPLVWAMHGGVGVNTMNDTFFAETGLSPALRDRFISDCEKLKKVHVDICCPSHPSHWPFIERLGEDRNDYTPFIDPASWAAYLDERAEVARDTIGKS